MRRAARWAAHLAIRAYQLTLSGLIGRQCRHWPSCSEYADEAIARHGLWIGGWMGTARLCRCGPFGTHGIDIVPDALSKNARWWLPWRYGRWRDVLAPPSPFACEAVEPDGAGEGRSVGVGGRQEVGTGAPNGPGVEVAQTVATGGAPPTV